MASHATPPKSGFNPLALVAGVVLMVAGVAYANKVSAEPDAIARLAESNGLQINLGETIATIGVLLILFPVVNAFFIGPLMAAISERNVKLEETFSEAEALRVDMGRLRNDYEGRLAATEAQAREQIQTEVRNAQELGRRLKAEATDDVDRMKAQASAELAAERAAVLGELRGRTADLALAAATKVVHENMDDARNRRLVDEFISELEVAR